MTDRMVLRDLEIRVGSTPVVTGVGLTLESGRVVALVGPSGAGKTLTARALLGMVGPGPRVVRADLDVIVGETRHAPYRGLSNAPQGAIDAAFAPLRGSVASYLPQDARAALDPLRTVGRQVALCIPSGRDGDPSRWLLHAGFPDPAAVVHLFPHELSGGMAKRVVIAQSLARGSRFLLVDEPTTGLDPPVQVALLRHLRRLADDGAGVLLITHDLRLLPGLADHIVLIDEGRVVEELAPDALERATSDVGRRLVQATAQLSWSFETGSGAP